MRLRKELGIFRVDTDRLQEMVMPSPERCLQGIYDLLPMLAKSKTGALFSELHESHQAIVNRPKTVSAPLCVAMCFVSAHVYACR